MMMEGEVEVKDRERRRIKRSLRSFGGTSEIRGRLGAE